MVEWLDFCRTISSIKSTFSLGFLCTQKREGAGQTAIAYHAAISACEKGLVPHKALEIFYQMKREGVQPTVVTYSALISALEKGQQWLTQQNKNWNSRSSTKSKLNRIDDKIGKLFKLRNLLNIKDLN